MKALKLLNQATKLLRKVAAPCAIGPAYWIHGAANAVNAWVDIGANGLRPVYACRSAGLAPK
jgi:hypothetical protein